MRTLKVCATCLIYNCIDFIDIARDIVEVSLCQGRGIGVLVRSGTVAPRRVTEAISSAVRSGSGQGEAVAGPPSRSQHHGQGCSRKVATSLF